MEAPARREPADIPAETQLQRENERLRAELAAANRLKHAVLQRCDTLRKQLGSARLAASAPYSAPPTKATEACASASHLSEETPRKRRRPASPGRGVTPAPASPEPLTSAKSQSISSPAPAIVAPVATPSQPPLPPRAPPLSAPSQMRGRSVWEGSAAATLMTPPRGHTPFVFTGGKQVQRDKHTEDANGAQHAESTEKEEDEEEEQQEEKESEPEHTEEEEGDESDKEEQQNDCKSDNKDEDHGDDATVTMAKLIATLQGLIRTASPRQKQQQRQRSPPVQKHSSKDCSRAWCAVSPDTSGVEPTDESEQVLLPETRHAVRCQLERWRRKYSQQDPRDARAKLKPSRRSQVKRQPAAISRKNSMGQRQHIDQDPESDTMQNSDDKQETPDQGREHQSEHALKQVSKQKVQQRGGEKQAVEQQREMERNEVQDSPQVEFKKDQVRQLQEKLKMVSVGPERITALSARVGELVKLKMSERLEAQLQEHGAQPSSEHTVCNGPDSCTAADSPERTQSTEFVTPRSSPHASPQRRHRSPSSAPKAQKTSSAVSRARLVRSSEKQPRSTAAACSPLIGRTGLSRSQKPPLSGSCVSLSPGTANAAHALHMPSVAPRIATRAGRAAYDRSPLRNRLPRDVTPVATAQANPCPVFGSKVGDAFVAGADATPESPGARAAAGGGIGSSQHIPRRRLAAINVYDSKTLGVLKRSPGDASCKVEASSSQKEVVRNARKGEPDDALKNKATHTDRSARQLGLLRKAGKAAAALMADVEK